jgi:hypothetical protein
MPSGKPYSTTSFSSLQNEMRRPILEIYQDIDPTRPITNGELGHISYTNDTEIFTVYFWRQDWIGEGSEFERRVADLDAKRAVIVLH